MKWTEYRTDHMLSAGHGNERVFLDVEVPVMSDGTILGFKVRAFDDAGAYLHYEPLGAVIWSQVDARLLPLQAHPRGLHGDRHEQVPDGARTAATRACSTCG